MHRTLAEVLWISARSCECIKRVGGPGHIAGLGAKLLDCVLRRKPIYGHGATLLAYMERPAPKEERPLYFPLPKVLVGLASLG